MSKANKTDGITKIMIVSNLNPVAIGELYGKLKSDNPSPLTLIWSAQFVALALEPKGVNYTQGFYPAIKVLSENIVKEDLKVEGTDTIILFGTLDNKTKKDFDAILGYKDDSYEDYIDFDESTNKTNIRTLDYDDCDCVYTDYGEFKKFLRKLIDFKRETK